MFKSKLTNLAALFAALALGACASTAAPGLTSAGPTYVASVEVNQHDASAPPAFAAALREAVMSEAALYGNTGRPVALKIDLDRVHFKNALQALTIGDDNQAEGRVAVVDPSAGQLMTFAVQVNAEESGLSGVDIGMAVIGAFDPTGAVDAASTVGSAASAEIDRSGTAAMMRANFAAETLRQIYGDARARTANSARQDRTRARIGAKTPTP